MHEMSNLLSLLQQTNKVVYIMGDYNINLLNVHTHIPTADFIDMMYSYSFFPPITKPTRVTVNTAMLIDNIFCNDIDCLDMMNGIFYNDISDHFLLFFINSKGHIADTKQYITKRMLTNKNISSFQHRLANADWNNIMSCSECQQGYRSGRDHNDNLLTENKSNLKKIRSVINDIKNKRKHKPMTSKFVVGDR